MKNNSESEKESDLSRISRRRDAMVLKFGEMSAALSRLEDACSQASDGLSQSRRRLAANEKERTEDQRVVFHLRTRNSKAAAEAGQLREEIERKSRRLAEIEDAAAELKADMNGVDTAVQHLLGEVADLQGKQRNLPSRVDDLESEKQKLVAEVDAKLSKTSIEREQFEAKAGDLNRKLIGATQARDDVKNRLDLQQRAIDTLQGRIPGLEQKAAGLSRLKTLFSRRAALAAELDKLQGDCYSADMDIQALRKDRDEKREQLDILTARNTEMENKIHLDEERVSRYFETKALFDVVKGNCETDLASVLEQEALLRQLLDDKSVLEVELEQADQKLERLITEVNYNAPAL